MGDSQVSFLNSCEYICQMVNCFAGILNGKSWVKAMRSFRGVAAALMKRFLSNGLKTFENIEQYLDSARLHPTGHHWVDNFLLPTLLIHQFERAEREGDVGLKLLTLKRMMKYFFLLDMYIIHVTSPSTCWRWLVSLLMPK